MLGTVDLWFTQMLGGAENHELLEQMSRSVYVQEM